MSETLAVGIVGTGTLGTRLGEQFVDVLEATVVAVVDIDPKNRREAGDALGVDAASQYESYEAMIETEPLDAVVIATPHTLHYEQVVTALEADLHVLCEKPLATDLDDARDLVERSRERDEVLMVGYQRHLGPAYVHGRDKLEDADPKFVTAEISQNWYATQRGTWRTNPDLSGGGQLYDTGSHLIDAVLWMSDLNPESVSAEMVFADEAERVDVQAVLNVTFEGGCVASISVSGDSPRVREHIHFWGDDGGVYVEGHDWEPRETEVIEPDGSRRYPGSSHDTEQTKARAFVDSIRTGEEPPATAADAYEVTAVTEAAYRSAETGERVSVDTEL
jgi:predicted dehydrogenase